MVSDGIEPIVEMGEIEVEGAANPDKGEAKGVDAQEIEEVVVIGVDGVGVEGLTLTEVHSHQVFCDGFFVGMVFIAETTEMGGEEEGIAGFASHDAVVEVGLRMAVFAVKDA